MLICLSRYIACLSDGSTENDSLSEGQEMAVTKPNLVDRNSALTGALARARVVC